MKKMIMMLAAVAMAACAQAARISWSTGMISGPNGESLAGSTAYTTIVTLYADAAGQELIASQTKTKFSFFGDASEMIDGLAYSTTYYISAVISANDGSASLSAGIASLTTRDDDRLQSIGFTSGTGFDTPGSKWGTWEMAAVPEPTSGLLLLLGMAGLALKRKVA